MKRTVILLFTVIILVLAGSRATGLSQVGSRGDEVREIQTVLSNGGYYTGKVDGIFGTATRAAVIAFQKDNGLVADGIVGSKTLAAMGIGSTGDATADSDFVLLARIISAEARGEPYIGQVAVGAVVLNRIDHPSFPDSLSGVIYQHGAFSCLYDGQFYTEISDSAYAAARDALNGLDPTGGAIYYYNPAVATNQWIRSRPVIFSVGGHVFCS